MSLSTILTNFATYSSYSTSYNYGKTAKGIAGAAIGILIVELIISLAISALMLISMWKIFVKAGREGWKAIIPIYNMYVLTEISGQNGLLCLLVLIPGVGALIWSILVALKLAPAFGKDTGFAVGLILVPVIFYPILGLSKNITYGGATPAAGAGAAPANPAAPATPATPAAGAGAAPAADANASSLQRDPWLGGNAQ